MIPRQPEPLSRPAAVDGPVISRPWLRYGVSVALGLAGLLLNRLELPILSPETPEFLLGGIPVLLSFVLLGPRAGLVTVGLTMIPVASAALETDPWLAGAILVYTLEAVFATRLYRLSGSMVFSVSAFWLMVGWALDLVVYRWGLDLATGYTAILYLKQILNGVFNAIVVEILLAAIASILPLARLRPGVQPLRNALFGRITLAAGIPLLLLAVLATRETFERDLELAYAHQDRIVQKIALRSEEYLEDRQREIVDLARRIEGRTEPIDLGEILRSFRASHPSYLEVRVEGPEGEVLARDIHGSMPSSSSPVDPSEPGRPDGTDAGPTSRHHARLEMTFVPERTERALNPLLLLREPLRSSRGLSGGAIVAAYDARVAGPFIMGRIDRDFGELLTFFDRRYVVISSEDPSRVAGSPLDPGLRANLGPHVDEARFSYYADPPETRASRLEIDLRHATALHLEDAPFSILAETPAAALHNLLAPLALQILVLLWLTLLLLFLVVALVTRNLSRPLSILEAASEGITRGRLPPGKALSRLRGHPIREVRTLAENFRTMQDSLAYRDLLTGLPNLERLRLRLAELMASTETSEGPFAVALFDLDRFQNLDDELGSDTGSLVLQTLGRRLDEAVDDDEMVSRVGLDEFVAVLRNTDSMQELVSRVEEIRERLHAPISVGEGTVVTTTSLGVALHPTDGSDPEELLGHARTAMLAAKAKGRDTFRFYSADLDDRATHHVGLLAEVHAAIRAGEMHLAFQPITELASGRVVRLEALARWNHPERGPVGPGTFIPLIENSDRILELDRWVLEEAGRVLRARGVEGSCGIAVNLSARSCESEAFLDSIVRWLRHSGIPPSLVELEITERAAIHDVDRATRALERLRELGCTVALDDFGVGFASLGYLRRLPVDRIKLDRSYVAQIDRDPVARAIAESVVAMARRLEIGSVAEGIETERQLRIVEEIGFLEGQGYLLGAPAVPGRDSESPASSRITPPSPRGEGPGSSLDRE